MKNSLLSGILKSLKDVDSLSTNKSLGWQTRTKINAARRFVSTYYQSRQDSSLFDDVQTYCMFMGHARSGGSMLGALLDAHPNIVLADEVDIFQFLSGGFNREQLFSVLLARAEEQARKGKTKSGRDGKNYSYRVEGQWQGRYQQIRVIGNRKAGISTQRLGQDPQNLDALQDFLGDIQLKIITAIRNPYDTITTMHIRSGRSLESGIEQYFANCQTILDVRERISAGDFRLVRHEALIEDPAGCLMDITGFLGVEASAGYLESCANALYKKPAVSRNKIEWTQEYKDRVARQIEQFDFLQGYSFEA